MASPRVTFSESESAKEKTALLPNTKRKSSRMSSYGATLAALNAAHPPLQSVVPPPAKVPRSKSVPNIAMMAQERTPFRESHLRNGRFHYHHIIRLYHQRGVPHVLDDSPDIYRADWREHQSRNQKALLVGVVFFIAAVVLSQKGPDDISKTFGWIFAVLLGWGSCYCCNEGFCRNRPRTRPMLRDDHPVVVNVNPPPVFTQSSESINTAEALPEAVSSSTTPKPY